MSQANGWESSMDGYSLLLHARFDGTSLAAVRHKVLDVAGRCRMSGDRLDDFVVAVNEVMTNVVRHGGGNGHLRLWRNSELVCQVSDRGPGFEVAPVLRRRKPRPSSSGGLGLWMARRMSDKLTITSGPAGTTIGVHAYLGAGQRLR
ncbi:hypothetical protein Ais01nite_49050 [Asanoa ishikariensis]|uniref:Anti-sigma regulatory factor (Ser/Thr protein kinase) n=1 Tax=Asanoa ishikariensis TaxID=137265 RepID=A0A1H3RST9_9ACTN|nr:ATP-binding protein [Asanoa ishikariensis]GIF66870.1 hypothetical protein Ais01nite_49050 [Asanoa ishikariensis]SDZ28746.1 Anti-sigma regulatory factor (Ser/Thr protein kinase) [Asanoa ishikariensis]